LIILLIITRLLRLGRSHALAARGEAMAHGANVADMAQVQDMIAQTMEKWDRVDILVNNAGILRDKSFGNMPIEDLKFVVDLHLMGAAVLFEVL
jgi:NADP-dependent 3-hydroxy acid dehydrogenase YdfG